MSPDRSALDEEPKLVSLVIAITGHMDIPEVDYPALQAQIEGIFEKLATDYPHTPLILLSGFAKGADRIAVAAALKVQAEKKANLKAIAVLPMKASDCAWQFPDTASEENFNNLLKASQPAIELPTVPAEEQTARYVRLGEFLVDQSQILIALWDKKRPGTEDGLKHDGGTADVVAMKLGEARRREGTDLELSSGVGPVYEILVRRDKDSPMPIGAKFVPAYPAGMEHDDYDASYKLLDRFNTDLLEYRDKLYGAAQESYAGLCEGVEPVGLSKAMTWAASVYAWADVLAIRFARRSLWYWHAAFVWLALAGVALTLLHSGSGNFQTFAGYWALMGLAFGTAYWAGRGNRRDRHEDYRALAEALRVQFFWMVAGLQDVASQHYLRKHVGDMGWIRDAMSECGLYDGAVRRGGLRGGDAASRLGLTRTWVEGQARYFLKTSRRHDRRRVVFKWLAMAAVAAGGALVPAAGLYFMPKREEWHVVSGILMWWAGLAYTYSEFRGFEQEARQYERMYDLFDFRNDEIAKLEKEGAKSFGAAEKAIRDLGIEALRENGDWLAMHRERKQMSGLGWG